MVAPIEERKSLFRRFVDMVGPEAAMPVALAATVPCRIPRGSGGDGRDTLADMMWEYLEEDTAADCPLAEEDQWAADLAAFHAEWSKSDMSSYLKLTGDRQTGKTVTADVELHGNVVGTLEYVEVPMPVIVQARIEDKDAHEFLWDLGSILPPTVVAENPDGTGERLVLPRGLASALYAALHLHLQSHA